jgi:hypothetical protein
LEARRLVAYIIGLILLAFALGSLSRSVSGGSLLFRSYWLFYLVYLGPFLVLGIMVAMIIVVGRNWRDLGAGIGHGIARKRKIQKRRSPKTFIISVAIWAIALWILITKPGSVFNPIQKPPINATQIFGIDTTPSFPPWGGSALPVLSSFIQNDVFSLAFLGLLVVGGLVLAQGLRVAMTEMGEMNLQELQARRAEGLQTFQAAMRLISDQAVDPRNRIIACYQLMIMTASRLGAPTPSDLTARELERTIRSMFALKGSETSELTLLFEEARYSLHEIGEKDAAKARTFLEAISLELKTSLPTEN